MKNYFRFFGIVTLFVAIGFLTVGCSSDADDAVGKLKGAWQSDTPPYNNIIVTFSGNNGTFTQITADNIGWAIVRERGYITLGKEKFKDIKRTDELRWSAQSLLYDPNSYQLAGFRRCTLILSEDGKTLKCVIANGAGTDPYVNYTKK